MKTGDKYILKTTWFGTGEREQVIILGCGPGWVCYQFDDGSVSGDTVVDFLSTSEEVIREVLVGQVYRNGSEELTVRVVEGDYAWCRRGDGPYYGTYTTRDLLGMKLVSK